MAKTKTSVVPLADRVLIRPLETKGDATTASGIILPGKDASEKHERGEIVAAGPGRFSSEGKRVAMEVKKGDIVWFKRGYDAEEVKVDGVELVLTSEGNIIALEK
jgi:chaperonin GroES